jgi:L-threonylcarbamoyladenylate synthase
MTALLPATETGIAHAAALLRAGELLAFCTETVYGLGGDATNGRAVAAIFTAKGRPHFNPLIVHVPSAEAAFAHVLPSPAARQLAAAFWPGPLTLVLPRRVTSSVQLLAGAGLDSLAVRVPAHPAAQALLRATALPIAAPSANRSGRISPTTAAHVMDDLDGRIAAVLDCGPASIGLESTVLDLTGDPFLLRPGGIPIEAIEAIIGRVGRGISPAQAEGTRSLRSPGLLVSHYAPILPVRLNASGAMPGEALLAFGDPVAGAGLTENLSPGSDLTEAAANLFAALRSLDEAGRRLRLGAIAVMPIPLTGLGLAINDRLQRAAAPRT